MCFSTAASSENDQGSMNLASNTASRALTNPSSVAARYRWTGCWTQRWMSVTDCPVLRSYQVRLSVSVVTPSWTMRSPLRSAGSASPRFSCHSRISAASSGLIMIRASEPPRNCRRFGSCDRRAVIGSDDLKFTGSPLIWRTGNEVVTSSHMKLSTRACDKCTSSDGVLHSIGRFGTWLRRPVCIETRSRISRWVATRETRTRSP